MSVVPPVFFTVDHGTASTAAALIVRVGERSRLVASGAQPAAIPIEPLLARLADEVRDVDPALLAAATQSPTAWRRVESATRRPRWAVVCGASTASMEAAEAAVASSGWRVVGRVGPERAQAGLATEYCLDPDVELIVLAALDPVAKDEREGLADLVSLIAAALGRRNQGVDVLLVGGAASRASSLPGGRVVLGPAPSSDPDAAPDQLRDLLETMAVAPAEAASGASGPADGRRALIASTRSLATRLDRRVELVDIGAAAGVRALADPRRLIGSLMWADAALVPPEVIDDDRRADQVLAWSTIRADQASLRDRVRNLALAPWRGVAGDGSRLRLAAARAALTRLDAAWQLPDEDGRAANYGADLLVASGGAFAVAPAPAVAMALLDTLRRPGAMALAVDHARILGPLGGLEDADERGRLLDDLFEDALLPLGSVIVATGLRSGRHRDALRITTNGGATSQVELVPGGVQLVDLPPGVAGLAELTTRDGAWVGVRSRSVAISVAGGLGGLMIDTREYPLALPDRPERRRDLLDAWQRPLWPGAES
ncbi:MAG: hypothetical protein ACRDF7_06570 [Candidatus Limnocylindrales bacterium]